MTGNVSVGPAEKTPDLPAGFALRTVPDEVVARTVGGETTLANREFTAGVDQ